MSPALQDILDAPPQKRWSPGGMVEYGPDGSKYYSHNNSADASHRRARHQERMGFDPSNRAFDDHHRWLDGEPTTTYHGAAPRSRHHWD